MPTTDSDESEESVDQMQDDELLSIRADIVDESDRNPNLSTSPDNGQPLHVTSNNIRDVLLASHKNIMEDILISLPCSQSGVITTAMNSMNLHSAVLQLYTIQ